MMKKCIFFLIVGLISQSKLHAQASFSDLENHKIMYPSPTAAGLGKFGEYPVSLYNGLVNIGQDIVTVKSGHLALNVSLSYHASGNRPSDIPGWVGLGFSLNAGGVITRTIRDLPDDSQYGFYSSNTALQYEWNNHPNSDFIERYFGGTLDPRSDLYQFNFCGQTGEFLFDWDKNIHFKQKVPFIIQELYGPGGFAGFKLTTDDGTVYTFDQAERSHFNFSSLDHPASSWYLTKISNLSGDLIVLKYTAPMSKFRYRQYPVTRKESAGDVGGAVLETGPIITQASSMDEVIYLDEIDFNNGKLLFGKSTRTDPYFVPDGIDPSFAEEKKLDLITLEDNTKKVIKKWKFKYYENSSERLKLKNLIVQATDETDVENYSFVYNNLKLPLPQPGPITQNPYLSNNVDYWGYFNDAINGGNRIPKMYLSEFNQYVGSADRKISPSYVQAEILNKITYPTGGYTYFEYESNDYYGQGASFAIDQNPMTKIDLEPYTMNYNRDDGFELDPTTVSFTLTVATHVNIQYSAGADGSQHGWVAQPGTTYQADYQLAAGTYTLASLLNTSELTSSSSVDITNAHGTVIVYRSVPVVSKVGPGVRIKSITTNDGITSRTKSFEYKYGGSQNSNISSGFLSVFPAFYAPLQSIALNMSGYYLTSDPINDIGDGAPVGYSRVVERFQDNSYIVHNYTTIDDYPDETMPFTNGFSDPELAHMSSNDYWRGLETNTSYYSSTGILQKTISNNYDVLPGSLTNVQCIEVKPTVGIITCFGCSVNNVNATLNSLYYVHSCFLYNSARFETTYDKNGANPLTTTIHKYYDNVAHLQPTRITTYGSDGSVITTSTSFPDDYAAGVPFIDYMHANHLISFPVEQVVSKQKGGLNNIVSGNIITYKTTGAGLVDNLLKLETSGPVLQANFKFSNRLTGVLPPSSSPSQYSADTRYKPVLAYTQYDNRGNPLETVARNGIKTAYLWGYGQEYPVAQVVGTDYATSLGKINNPSLLNNPSDDGALRSELNKLRTIPNTFVTTYTYAPLTGVTSQTDPNSKTTYYEYDLFKRLMVIRDKDNNILKKYCYNYAGQPERCNVYASAAINGNYYSQNCPSGQGPVSYHVTVPQGTFMSYVDQQTANQLAQQYAQGQANEHGTCQVLNVSVYGENNHGTNINIQLHNVASGQNYFFTVYAHDAGTLGDVPPGTYDITITPNSSTGWYNYSVACGYWADGPGAMTFYGVSMSISCNSIEID